MAQNNTTKKSAAIVICPPKHPNEEQRLEALRKMKILDTADEDIFDGITRVAKRIFDVPIILVSLVDENRQWFKSCIGLNTRQTGRDVAFCAYAILSENYEPLIIEDALNDSRFCNNPLVTGEPFIRFYAGAPLITKEGYPLGTLCAIDRRPRVLTPDDIQCLKDCASVVVRMMEMRLSTLEQAKHLEMQNVDLDMVAQDRMKLLGAVNFFNEAFVMWNAHLQVIFVNDSFVKITGYEKEEATKSNGIDMLICDKTDPNVIHLLNRSFGAKEKVTLEMASRRKNGEYYWVSMTVQPTFNENGELNNFYSTFSDQTKRKQAEVELQHLQNGKSASFF